MSTALQAGRHGEPTMTLSSYLARIVGWLREGYPPDAPRHGYSPILALLGSRLTEEEVTLVVSELDFSAGTGSAEEIEAAIRTVTRIPASDSDIARVRARLTAGGRQQLGE